MSCQTISEQQVTSIAKQVDILEHKKLKIVAFLCNWCSYAGADKAGANQLPVPAELSVIRVMCSGRVEPTLILEAFASGADGVMVLACHPGDCHYKQGNLQAACRAELLERLLPQLGIKAKRLCFDYISAAEAEKFSRLTSEFCSKLQNLD